MNSELSNLAKITITECEEKLVDLSDYDFVLEPQYFKRGLYSDQRILVRESVAAKLKTAKDSLPKGYNFKIWDGYRTMEVQKKLFINYTARLRAEHPTWNEEQIYNQAAKYVCPPDVDFVPGHLTGGAIDLTIIDQNGKELAMGTGFDEFVEKANTYFYDEKQNLTEEEKIFQSNRIMLREVLLKEDFATYPDEWWHFNFGNQAWAQDKGKEMAIYRDAYQFAIDNEQFIDKT